MAAMAAILKFFKQHLLPNPKSDWAETWWAASQWYRDSKLLKLFHSDIQEGGQVAILKFFKLHETWWEASQWHRDSKLLKSFLLIPKMGTSAAVLKLFKLHLLLNPKSDWAETWWEASQWHRDSKLLKLSRSDIQNGCQGGHLEILQTTSPPKP